jgi:hypothetical protein
MFQPEDNEEVKDNFVIKIAVLKSVPKRNKNIFKKQEKEIYLSEKMIHIFYLL